MGLQVDGDTNDDKRVSPSFDDDQHRSTRPYIASAHFAIEHDIRRYACTSYRPVLCSIRSLRPLAERQLGVRSRYDWYDIALGRAT